MGYTSKMKFAFISICILNVISLAQGQTDCASDVMTRCGDIMVMNPQPTDDPNIICPQVDNSVNCVMRALDGCDEMTSANIMTMINDYASAFTQQPFQCSLSSINTAVMTDPCTTAISQCTSIEMRLRYAQSQTESCAIFDMYLMCMRTNTTACQTQSALTNIRDGITNATNAMDMEPFMCFERSQYDVRGCEANFGSCMGALNVVFQSAQTGMTQNMNACGTLQNVQYCVETNTTMCSPRVQEGYRELMQNLTFMFMGPPFNCTPGLPNTPVSNDPCTTAINQCEGIHLRLPYAQSQTESCAVFDMYIDCLRSNTTACETRDQLMGIRDNLNNATDMMDAEPFMCFERFQYDIQACEANFGSCMMPLNMILMSAQQGITPDMDPCGALRNILYCVDHNTTMCSPRLHQGYHDMVQNLTIMFQAQPFNCTPSDFPSLTLITHPPSPVFPTTTLPPPPPPTPAPTQPPPTWPPTTQPPPPTQPPPTQPPMTQPPPPTQPPATQPPPPTPPPMTRPPPPTQPPATQPPAPAPAQPPATRAPTNPRAPPTRAPPMRAGDSNQNRNNLLPVHTAQAHSGSSVFGVSMLTNVITLAILMFT